jgi:hypothetical protein
MKRLALATVALAMLLALLELAGARAMTGVLAGMPGDGLAPLLGLLYVITWLAFVLLAPPLLLAAGAVWSMRLLAERRARR